MGAVAGYVMDLYCDCNACFKEPYFMAKEEVMGETFTECKREATQIGWVISRDRRRAFAKGHKRVTQTTIDKRGAHQ